MMPNEWEPPEWFEPKDLRPRYRVARVAFALSGIGLAMLALEMTCFLLAIFGQNPNLRHLIESPGWHWVVGAPLTWGTFLGSLLLLGRFDDPGWKKRSVFLFLMNTFDLGIWCLDNAQALGLHTGPLPFQRNAFLLDVIGPFMNLIELVLFAGLARDVCTHLGRSEAVSPFAATRAAVGVSIVLELVVLFHRMDFGGGWPLRLQPIRDPLILLALLAAKAALAAAAYFTVFLMAMACQQCSGMLKDLERQHQENDPFA